MAQNVSTSTAPLVKVALVPEPKAKSLPTPAPTGPAREGVDQVEQIKADAEVGPGSPVNLQPATRRELLNEADIPNVVQSGVGGNGAPPVSVAFPTASNTGSKMIVQMLVPYASAQTVLHAGKAYVLSDEFAQQLLNTDPPSATTVISESNRRALRPTAPDPEDKGSL